jgi:lysophospholipase L1-like esterase
MVLGFLGTIWHSLPAQAAATPNPTVGCTVGMPNCSGPNQTSAVPGKYYLSLGDSIAFGYQDARAKAEAKATGTVNPAHFNTGYTDDLYRMLRAIDPGIQLVNYACPGETSTEFISAPGCPSYPFPLHNGYSTSQLQAALAFLSAHPGQVSPITVDLGANDILHLVASCGGLGNLNCVAAGVPALFKQIGANLAQILPALRQAAPNAQIMLVGLYNPFAAGDASTNALAQSLDQVLVQAAEATGVTYVSTLDSFNLNSPQPATICFFTLFCTADQDIHPSDAGYLQITKLLWLASGFASAAHGFFVTFNSTAPGRGEIYFGSGPGCLGLVEVATQDLQPPGGTTHIVYVSGNDLPGTIGNNGIIPGVSYSYETVTITPVGAATDNNGGACFIGAQPGS